MTSLKKGFKVIDSVFETRLDPAIIGYFCYSLPCHTSFLQVKKKAGEKKGGDKVAYW